MESVGKQGQAMPGRRDTPCRVGREVPRLAEEGGDHGWQSLRLPPELGDCRSERLVLDDDLALLRSDYCPSRFLIEESINPHDRPLMVITFGLNGRSRYVDANGNELCFRAGHTLVTRFSESWGERHYEAGRSVSQLRLLVGARTLARYLGESRARELLAGRQVTQLACGVTSQASAGHALALSVRERGPRDRLALHIHALSLLAEQFSRLCPEPLRASPRPSPDDLERIEQARELMLAEMDQPLTLAYLAARVGLSESRLKEGFRSRFQTSPHRMLQTLRLHRAHALLESGLQVAQVAYRVGYRHPSNFSAAFTAFYGRPPKSVAGRRG